MTLPFLPFVLPGSVQALLEHAYQTPPRAYHNLAHVREVLSHYSTVPSWQDASSVALAILFHDAIYEAGRKDNEARSAELAERTLSQQPIAASYDIARIRQLILLTAQHGTLDGSTLDSDAAHFLDCDMAILGSSTQRFHEYEQAIAIEYSHVPAEAYRVGRRRFLEKLLEAPRIYFSEHFFTRLEQPARANIRAALGDAGL